MAKKKNSGGVIALTPAQSRLQLLYYQATLDPAVRTDADASGYAVRVYLDSAMAFGVSFRDGIPIDAARKRNDAAKRGHAGGSHPKKPTERGKVEELWKAWIGKVDAFPSLESFAIFCAKKFELSKSTVRGWCLEFAKVGLLRKPWVKRHGGKLGADWQAVFSQR